MAAAFVRLTGRALFVVFVVLVVFAFVVFVFVVFVGLIGFVVTTLFILIAGIFGDGVLALVLPWLRTAAPALAQGPPPPGVLVAFMIGGLSDKDAFERSWYCEINNYDFNNPQFKGGFTQNCRNVNGHFTEVVWKDTCQLGCGRLSA